MVARLQHLAVIALFVVAGASVAKVTSAQPEAAPEAACRVPGGGACDGDEDAALLLQVRSTEAAISRHKHDAEDAAEDTGDARQSGTRRGHARGDPSGFWGGCSPSPAPGPYPIPCPSATAYPWCDPAENTNSRAAKLVARMSVRELAEQVSCDIFGGVPAIERLGVNQYNFIRENNHGLLWNNVCPLPTMFPQMITMAAAFNEPLWTAIGEAAAVEARYNFDLGKQNSLFLQTNFNIFLDPRWGRGQEVAGECPAVNTAFLRAWLKGVQAPKGPGGVPLAGMSCKHFTAYSFEGAGGWPLPYFDSNRHNFNAIVTKQDLADTHLPMYKACAEGGAKGMMTAYNAINGPPAAADRNLTVGLMRDTFGFAGTVVTDCLAVQDIWLRHKWVKNAKEAARAALEGGTDIECGNTIKGVATDDLNPLKPLLQKAVQHSFNVRFELGEFDPRSSNPPTELYPQAAHARLAYDAAVQGATLLKNQGGMLPLKPGLRLAVLGPLKDGNWEMLGNYAAYKDAGNWSDSPNVVTPVQGLQNCGLAGELVFPEPPGGPGVCSPTDQVIPGAGPVQRPNADAVLVVAGLYCNDERVQDVDERPEESEKCKSGCLESEGCDRQSLALPAGQVQLIERAASWGLPLVLVLVHGGAVDLSAISRNPGVGAILWMGYPGQQAGTALASILFGKESPSGRLTQTFYTGAYADQLSIKDMRMRPHAESGFPGRGYRFVDEKWVVYPFGHGLSYFPWRYKWAPGAALLGEEGLPCTAMPEATCTSKPTETCFFDATCSASPPGLDGLGCNAGGVGQNCRFCGFGHYPACPSLPSFRSCSVDLEVATDCGTISGEPTVSVLLFLEPPPCPSAPKKLLRQFTRARGESSRVSFKLTKKDFELADTEGQFAVKEGRWTVGIGEPYDLKAGVTVTQSGCEVTYSITA